MDRQRIAAIYSRLSKEDLESGDRESESIQNQKSMLLSYAASQGWAVYKIYCDEDYSGAYAGEENLRPEFRAMLEDAQAGKFGIVLCKTQSRFSRNIEVVEQYIHGKFPQWGIRFISVLDNADTAVAGNKKSRQINSLVNEWYLEDLSVNIRAVFENKMARGEYLASFAPYGYRKDPDRKNHLVVDEAAAGVVRQIFAWNAAGYGTVRISRMLNDRLVPNPRKQQELGGLRKHCLYAPDDMGQWSSTTVGDILHNPVYCGDVVQHRYQKVSYKSRGIRKCDETEYIVVRDVHEPLVSRAVFEAAQNRMSQGRRSAGTGTVHILAGRVCCAHCGRPMQKIHSVSSKAGHVEYLRCRNKYAYASERRCPVPNVRTDEILDALGFGQMREAVRRCMDDAGGNQILAENSLLQKRRQEQLVQLEREMARLETAQRNLYLDKVDGVVSAEQFKRMNREFSGQIDGLRRSADELKASPAAEEVPVQKDGEAEMQCLIREVLDRVIARIEFGADHGESERPRLKVVWAI